MDHSKRRVDNAILLQLLAGFVVSACVLTGISGTIYKLIEPEGWFVLAFGRSLGLSAALLAALLGAAAVVWALPGWKPTQRARIADAVVYGFAAAGLLYLGKRLAYGGF
jgi:hypothetical protein